MRLLHNTELYRVNITNSDYPSAQAFRYQNPMRLLHNTELCRVNITNSDYPSVQAFRYQNPTIGVLCLWGITEVASICMSRNVTDVCRGTTAIIWSLLYQQTSYGQ